MLYSYNSNQLRFNRIKYYHYILYGILPVILIAILVFTSGYRQGLVTNVEILSQKEKTILLESIDPFSEEKLVEMLIGLKVKFPYIPYAQSKLETGSWKFPIFLENHNLFGMKESYRRITTAKGTNRKHAYYDTWRESVYDYAFYQCRYLSTISTEEEYYQYLGASYAEDPAYVSKLKNLIEKEQIKSKFKTN
jgi:hypothetical protein